MSYLFRWIVAVICLSCASAQAIYTELGASYSYKTSFVDSLNNIQSQGITGSLSFYFWERVALEASYTNEKMVKKEQSTGTLSPSTITTTENDDIYGLDVIYVFADHKASIQPYVKAGMSYINKSQTSQIDNNPPWAIGPYSGWGPSYGAGIKIFITDSIAIRMGYDVQVTPIDNNNTAQDVNGRAGLSWMF